MGLGIVPMVAWGCSHNWVGDELGAGNLGVREGVVVGGY